MRPRTLTTLVRAHAAVEGEGMPIRRALPTHGLALLDPFLLLDHFGPVRVGPGGGAGIPPHPHRGFQTLTLLLQGALRHRDSRGGFGRLDPGGAQWMSAASGILHEEMPEPERMEEGGAIEGLQLWVNLPAALKGEAPEYRDLQPGDLPWTEVTGGRLKVVLGDAGIASSPAPLKTPVLVALLDVASGGRMELALPAAWNAGIYGVAGEAEGLGPGDLAVFASDGDGISLSSARGATLYLIAGKPLGEPIARYGPFVMNTEAEIHQALTDARAGRMGTL